MAARVQTVRVCRSPILSSALPPPAARVVPRLDAPVNPPSLQLHQSPDGCQKQTLLKAWQLDQEAGGPGHSPCIFLSTRATQCTPINTRDHINKTPAVRLVDSAVRVMTHKRGGETVRAVLGGMQRRRRHSNRGEGAQPLVYRKVSALLPNAQEAQARCVGSKQKRQQQQ